MPKIVTDADRKRETAAHAMELSRALSAAQAADRNATATDAEKRELWAGVANHAGQIQRRTRLLAGLGRGG